MLVVFLRNLVTGKSNDHAFVILLS